MIIIVAVVVLIVFYFYNKNKTSRVEADVAIVAASPSAPCIPFSQKQYDDALRILRSKCGAKLLIPVVGVGYYSKCVSEGRANIKEVTIC